MVYTILETKKPKSTEMESQSDDVTMPRVVRPNKIRFWVLIIFLIAVFALVTIIMLIPILKLKLTETERKACEKDKKHMVIYRVENVDIEEFAHLIARKNAVLIICLVSDSFIVLLLLFLVISLKKELSKLKGDLTNAERSGILKDTDGRQQVKMDRDINYESATPESFLKNYP